MVFFQFPLRVICLLWKFTGVLHFTVKLYEFKFRALQSTVVTALFTSHRKGYYGHDMLHERKIEKWCRLLKPSFINYFYCYSYSKLCIAIFLFEFLLFAIFSFEKKKKVNNGNVYLHRGNLFIYCSDLPSDLRSHMLDAAHFRKIKTSMRFLISCRSYMVAKCSFISSINIDTQNQHSIANSITEENCTVVNILKNWKMILFSRNRKQIAFKRFSFFILFHSTIFVEILPLSLHFQCSNFASTLEKLYIIITALFT